MINELQDLVDTEKTTIIGGDINICALKKPNNYVTASLREMGFQQIVTQATHTDGGSIDHIYVAQGENVMFEWVLEYFPKYYSDHDGLCLTLWEACETQ